jgi:hypothetical protein
VCRRPFARKAALFHQDGRASSREICRVSWRRNREPKLRDLGIELSRATLAAQQVLLDQTLFEVSPAQHAKFLALMNAPLGKNKRVQKLLSRRAPWKK